MRVSFAFVALVGDRSSAIASTNRMPHGCIPADTLVLLGGKTNSESNSKFQENHGQTGQKPGSEFLTFRRPYRTAFMTPHECSQCINCHYSWLCVVMNLSE